MRYTTVPMTGSAPSSAAMEFIREMLASAAAKVKSFCVGVYQHCEAITVVTLSSLGLTNILGELPFWLVMPWWLESPLVIPVIAVSTIMALLWNGERRANNRMADA